MIKGIYKRVFPAPVELLSVHVPKAAGSSFQLVLKEIYGDSVYFDYSALMNRPTAVAADWRRGRRRSLERVPRRARAIHGHWPLIGYAERFPRAARIIWLREPVDRLVSHYYYWKQSAPPEGDHPLRFLLWEKDLDLLEFARLPQMRDVVSSHYLRGFELADLAFVGIVERFDEELPRLAATLGWPAVTAPHVNVTVHPEYRKAPLPESVRAEIATLNAADVELYRRAVRAAEGSPRGVAVTQR